MTPLEELRSERLRKLEAYKAQGLDPYPSKANRSHTIAEVMSEFDTLVSDGLEVTLVGRIMVIRGQGGILFADFRDGTGRFQAVLKEDEMDASLFALFRDTADAGDFIEVSGKPFTTNRGERSVLVDSWRLLTKSLLPLPDKYHGLRNEEERLRKRYLDLLQDEEQRALFVRKEKFWDVTRSFLKARGFLEVETPTLETTTGGAEARPFRTHHHDFDMDMYLRISVGELWQKRLMAAGFEKTFEIGKVYRNEGTSPEHLQEFTNMEFYFAYADATDGMDLVRELFVTIARDVYRTTRFTHHGHTFDLADTWKLIDYTDEIGRQTGIDIRTADEGEIRARLEELGVSYEGQNRERLTDSLWKYCRKNIAGPAFIINMPKLVAPLAKSQTGDSEVTQMFHPLIGGSEVGRGYSELNDPIDQRARFEAQQKLLEAGDEEAMMFDEEFIEMLEHGMPPTCGFGFGERLFAILEGKPLRDCQLFPLVRTK